MWWIVSFLFLFLLAFLIYLLFIPFHIEADSETGEFRFRFHWLAEGRLVADETGIVLHIRAAWWKKSIDLLAPQKPKTGKKAAVKKSRRKKRTPSISETLDLIRAVAKSFRIRYCFISIDTGSMPLNGVLYPWFYLLGRYTGHTIRINFHGEEIIQLQVQNTLARIVWALIKNKLKTKAS